MSLRRGGGGSGPGRDLVRAGLLCLVAAGCASDPPPALLTLIDAERLTLHDSELVPDSTKAAIRSYLGRRADAIWQMEPDPAMERLVGECRGLTAILDADALPEPGRTARVLVDVPDFGAARFRISRVEDQAGSATYTGEARGGELSILLMRDSIFKGRITTPTGTYDFRAGRLGLIVVDSQNTTQALRRLHLIPTAPALTLVARASAAEPPPSLPPAVTC